MSYQYNPIRTEAIKAAFAPLNGGLFGLAYGTAIRIGYEQIYPALFPKSTDKTQAPHLPQVMNQLTELYKIFGGMGAHEFGITQGVKNAMSVYENSALSLESQSTNFAFQLAQSGIGKGSSGGFDMNIIGDTLQAFQTWLTNNVTQQNFNVDQNLADLPPSQDKPFNDPIASSDTDKEADLKNDYLRRVENYTENDLRNLLEYATVTEQQKSWVRELLNSKFGNTGTSIAFKIEAEALAWSKERDAQINSYHIADGAVKSAQAEQTSARGPAEAKKAKIILYSKRRLDAKKALRRMSNDYRSPNNFIRTQAVILRRLLQTL